MRIGRLTAGAALAWTLLGLAGCGQPLKVEKTVKLDPGYYETYTFDAPRGEQKLTVTASADQPVSVWVFLADDLKVDKDTLNPVLDRAVAAKSGQAIAKAEEPQKEVSIEGTVPAKKEFRVLVKNTGKESAEVKLTVKGK
jgi:hypothetical protein